MPYNHATCSPTGKTPLSKTRQKMYDDALMIAAHIVKDLGIAFRKRGWFWTDYLGDRFGDFQWCDDLLERLNSLGCYYRPPHDRILIDSRLSDADVAWVLRHELAHKLTQSGRYDDLVQPRFLAYDDRLFNEWIAEAVVMAFESAKFCAQLHKLM